MALARNRENPLAGQDEVRFFGLHVTEKGVQRRQPVIPGAGCAMAGVLGVLKKG
jgi:hypothetical protein